MQKKQAWIKAVRKLSDGKNINFSFDLEDILSISVFPERILERKNEDLHQENRQNKTVKEKKDGSVIMKTEQL